MKKSIPLTVGGILLTQSVFSQELEVNIPHLRDEEGLFAFLSSSNFQLAILALAGFAALLGFFYMFSNLRMVYLESQTKKPDLFPPHFTDPANYAGRIGMSGSALDEYLPWVTLVDHELENGQDNPREEAQAGRGEL